MQDLKGKYYCDVHMHVNKTVIAYTNSRVTIQYLNFFSVVRYYQVISNALGGLKRRCCGMSH